MAFAPEEGRWVLDLEALKALISPKTKLLVVNFPHNPTGYLPTRDFLAELVSIIEEHGLILFCDEMYYGLVHSGTAPIPSLAALTPRAVVLVWSVEDLWPARAAQRLAGHSGRGAARECDQLEILYQHLAPPAPTEFLALAAWRAREQLCDRSIAQIESNLALAEEFFSGWPELFTWRRPMAGSTALVEMKVPSVTDFGAKMAEEAGVLIHPAVTLGGDDQHMRMGFGARWIC